MAISFDELRKNLESAGIRIVCDPEKKLILCLGIGGPLGVLCLMVRLVEDGEAIHFSVPRLATVRKDSKHWEKVLEVLMGENHRKKIGRACWDPSDGEVYLDWFHSIEDGTVTAKQLRRYVVTLFVDGMEVGRRVHHILEHGTDLPEEEKGLRGVLRHLLEEAGTLGDVPDVVRHLLDDLSRCSGDPGELRRILEQRLGGTNSEPHEAA
jgi:hypothetical protein